MLEERPIAYIINLGLKKKMWAVSTEKEKVTALCSTPPPSLLGLRGGKKLNLHSEKVCV